MDQIIPKSGKVRTLPHLGRIEIGFILLLAALAFIALVGLSLAAHATPYFSFDLTFARQVQSVRAPWFDVLMRAIGDPGYPPQVYVWLALMLIVFFKSNLKWEAIAAAFASIGVGVAGLIVKILVNRPRPSPELIRVANPALDGGKYSFPAGHVEAYVAILGFLLFLSIVLAHKYHWTRIVEIIGFGTFIVLVGLSRVYLGEHWLSDTLGAYLLGSLWLLLTIAVYEWGKPHFFVPRTKSARKSWGEARWPSR